MRRNETFWSAMKTTAMALNSVTRVTVPHPRPGQDVYCDTFTVLRGARVSTILSHCSRCAFPLNDSDTNSGFLSNKAGAAVVKRTHSVWSGWGGRWNDWTEGVGGAISVSPLCTYKSLMNIYMKKMHILCSLKWVFASSGLHGHFPCDPAMVTMWMLGCLELLLTLRPSFSNPHPHPQPHPDTITEGKKQCLSGSSAWRQLTTRLQQSISFPGARCSKFPITPVSYQLICVTNQRFSRQHAAIAPPWPTFDRIWQNRMLLLKVVKRGQHLKAGQAEHNLPVNCKPG